MNNLIENYEIILKNLKNTCADIESFPQIRKPKLSNLELIAINLTAAIAHVENSRTALNKAAELVSSGTLTGIEDGKADAFRHSFWNALGTAEFGETVMKLFAGNQSSEVIATIDLNFIEILGTKSFKLKFYP